MSIQFKLNFPPELEEKLRSGSVDLNNEASEAFAVQMFREGRLTHSQLAEALGIDRFATDALLKRLGVWEHSLTPDDFEKDVQTFDRLFAGQRS